MTDSDPGERRSRADDIFAAGIAAMLGKFADRPDKVRGILRGMQLDGSLDRVTRGGAQIPSGLAPFMRLPAPESETLVRARMAELMLRRYSADGSVTHEDLIGGGFSDAQITKHKHAAARIAGIARMAA